MKTHIDYCKIIAVWSLIYKLLPMLKVVYGKEVVPPVVSARQCTECICTQHDRATGDIIIMLVQHFGRFSHYMLESSWNTHKVCKILWQNVYKGRVLSVRKCLNIVWHIIYQQNCLKIHRKSAKSCDEIFHTGRVMSALKIKKPQNNWCLAWMIMGKCESLVTCINYKTFVSEIIFHFKQSINQISIAPYLRQSQV